jgi:hypothetical protein
MKKRLILLAVCMVCMFLMSASLAQALPQYYVNDTSGRSGSGGPFQIVGYTDPSVSFQTFCIEWNEHISLGGKYFGSVDPIVYYSSGNNSLASAAIDPNTSILYNYFLDNQSTLSDANKALIQNAIWAYQGQGAYGSPSVTGNYYYEHVSDLTASHRTIMALNLWNTNVGDGPYSGNDTAFANRAQSMLIATPEPGILILLSLGLVGVAGIRRKLKS